MAETKINKTMKNPVTTITGIALAIVSIVTAVGLINQEQSVTLTEYVPTIATAIGAIIAVFKASDKDADKSGI
jgi:hypothetical protein